jgi:hypothetical protein
VNTSGLLSTYSRQSAVLTIDVPLSDWQTAEGVLLFHALEVWRSRVGEWGPYEEVTAPGYTAASFPAADGLAPDVTTGPSILLHGKYLELEVDETLIIRTDFSGADPYNYATAATAINAQSRGRYLAYVARGILHINGVSAGSAASLRVVGGEAAPLLGLSLLSPENAAYGREPWTALTTGISRYTFVDRNSEAGFYYKTRLRNILTGAVSAFAPAFMPKAPSGLSADNRVVGYVRLASSTGGPDVSRRLAVRVEFHPTLIEGHNIAGGDIELCTDGTGYAETLLVPGTQIQVALGGTELVRSLVVPSTSFNLLDPAYGTDDVFRVQSNPERYASPRSRLPVDLVDHNGGYAHVPPQVQSGVRAGQTPSGLPAPLACGELAAPQASARQSTAATLRAAST